MSNMQVDSESSPQDMSKRQGLITVNDLNYVLEPDLSVATNKTSKKHFFQSQSYTPGQQAICILNSGADYIDTRRSFLQFELNTTQVAGVEYGFGTHGSACNLIKDITISTRSGDELCRIQDFNLLQNMLLPLTYDTEWFKCQGQMMAYGQRLNTSQRLAIPMYLLSPLFGYGRLMPAMLMSGLRIEITWAEKKFPFIASTATTADTQVNDIAYTINDAYFSLQSIQLSDSIQRALNELSATNGLEVVYCDWERTTLNQGNDFGGTINVEIRKSCSRALKAFARIRPTGGTVATNTPRPDNKRDSFRAEAGFPFLEYQWQLGSLYFPQQPVQGSTTDKCGVEAYAHTIEACDKFNGEARQPYLTFNGDYLTDGLTAKIQGNTATQVGEARPGYYQALAFKEPGSYLHDAHVLAVNLERSTMFNLAGVPVNNSRVLSLRAKLPTTGNSGEIQEASSATAAEALVGFPKRQLDVYLKYVKLARVFLNNVEVEQ
jgi:hypothetical protein